MKMDVPKEEAEAIARAIKFPHNEEWYSPKYDDVIEDVISIWKGGTKEQREDWKSGEESFYDAVEPGLSDDGWDYIGPFYTYMSGETIIKKTPPAAYGTVSRKVIIMSILEDDEDLAYELSEKVHDAWWEQVGGPIREAYKNGKVNQEFAKAMKPHENDDEAWEAIKVFRDSY